MEDKLINIEKSIGVSQQRQLIELSRELSRVLTEDEFFKIISIYNSVIDRLLEQAKKEGVDI